MELGAQVKLLPHGAGSGTLLLPPGPLARLGLAPGDRVQLCTQAHRAAVHIGAGARHDGLAWLDGAIMRRLHLPPGWPVRLRRAGDGQLHVGPFVGILCQRFGPANPYGPQTTFFRRLIRLGRELHMVVYVFAPGDVHRAMGAVAGWTWLDGRGWARRLFPLPHVLYDRGFVTAPVLRLQRWLRNRVGVQQFNSLVGSKWWVYRLMARMPDLAPYVPETRVLRTTADLLLMVRRHGTVYVKAAGGGKGIGIWVISANRMGGFNYRYTDGQARIHRGRTAQLGAIVHHLLGRPRQPWLIQPRVDLARWRGRIFDVRVLVQRDGYGQWCVTGTGARIGRPGSIISNLYGGGDAWPLEPVLVESLGMSWPEATALRARVEDIALRVARAIDAACRRTGHVGELGIDIGIDRAGRLWFFEANSRTGRNLFRQAGLRDSSRLADRRPLEFALHLAGFGPSLTEAVQAFP
ncbi:MAG: YheC/YheD family protein [Limnochordales bacterium]|nr:YheC/YheD family protein [Limnochordales bacterium]